MRVLVLGGGVVGVTTAFRLHAAGHDVRLIEREPAAALGTSYANGGIIHICETGPWARPGSGWQILRSLGREDASMLLRPSALPKMWRWGLSFLRECTEERYVANRSHNLKLGLESAAALAETRALTGIRYDEALGGIMVVCSDQEQMAHARHEFEPMAAEGLTLERCDTARLIELEPALAAATEPPVGGYWFAADSSGDCRKFTIGLAQWLEERGVEISWSTAVTGLLIEQGAVCGVRTGEGEVRADAVIVAMGVWSTPFLRPYGVKVPIWPIKGLSVTMPSNAWPDAPRMTLLNEGWFFGVTPLGDRIRIAGSAEVTGWDTTPSPARVQAVLERAFTVFPDLRRCYDPATAEVWAGLRPIVPNGRPLIGPTSLPGLYLNTGHGHLGWTLAHGSAKRLAASLEHSATRMAA